MSRPQNTLLSYLTADNQIMIKHSQSAEYIQPNILNQLNQLYKDVFYKMQQIKIYSGQQIQQQYWAQSQAGKIAYIRAIMNFFFDKYANKSQSIEQSGQIKCSDCLNYQQYLQKLENDIRQHIRLEQQLKLYQQNLQEKIQDQKKQSDKNLQYIQKLESAIEEFKAKQNNWSQKFVKLEEQNQKFKLEFGKNKNDTAEHSHRAHRQMSQTKSFRALRDIKQKQKQNTIVQKGTNKKEDKRQEKKQQRKQTRKSLQKRPSSSDKLRNAQATSIKKYPLAEKLAMQRNKDERRKNIQAKFELRR